MSISVSDHTRWSEGLESEVDFWRNWLSSKGGVWPEDFKERTDPHTVLQPSIVRYLDLACDPLRILDVGSGPLTVLGKQLPEHQLEITAIDPLANRYNALFEEVNLCPIVPPVVGEAEHLSNCFAPNSFDLVYAKNSIDHSWSPLRSIEQMLYVVKPGRYVILRHALDEGRQQDYAGLHQWNFSEVDGRFVIWRHQLRMDAHTFLEPLAGIEIETNSDECSITIALHKK